jgi:hypothetical protein
MGPTILPFASGGVNNSSGVYSSVVGGLMKPAIPHGGWCRNSPVANSLLFSAARNETNNTGGATGGSATLPVVCARGRQLAQ